MLNFLSLKRTAFGLDISDSSIKVAQLRSERGFLRFASFGNFSIKSGLVSDGKIENKDELAMIIKDCVRKTKGKRIRTKNVIASLPEERAFLQIIQMPKMEIEELKSAVRFEAENYIPVPLKDVYLDFQVVKPVRDHLDHLDVLIVALPRELVDAYLYVLRAAGLRPLAFEVEAQAIARAVIKGGKTLSRSLIIDLGANRTRFIIFAGHSLRFISSIPVCGKIFDKIIAKELKVSLKEAEKLKIKYGLSGKMLVEIKNGLRRKDKKEKIFEALVPCLTDLIEQIERCLTYYYTHAEHEHLPSGGQNIENVLLCGGGANLKEFDSFLAKRLNKPVIRANPLINISSKPFKIKKMMPSSELVKYTTALGLALRGI